MARITAAQAIAAGIAVAGAFGLGCDRGPQSVVPGSPITNVPYIAVNQVADPPVRATLARSPWIVLRLGRSGELDLPEPVDAPAVSVLGRSIAHIDITERRWDALMSLAFGTKRPKWLTATPVDPAALRELKILPPAQWVWLTGPEGSCQAKVGRPWFALYGGERGDVLEVSYELLGCEGGPWAPVGSLADQLPKDLTFVFAEPGEITDLPADTPWDDPLAEFAVPPNPIGGSRKIIRTLTVPTEAPSPTEVLQAELVVDDKGACINTSTRATFGWWDEEVFSVDEPVVDHETTPLLAGAFVRDGEAHALLFREGVWAWVAIPPSEPIDVTDVPVDEPPPADPGPPEWTRIELATALWHPDDAAALTYVPTPCRRGG
jgi:hypothetical protein